jgi:hypothetical protein
VFEDLRELYQEVILDHDRNPWNLLQPADASREVLGNNPLWGRHPDRLSLDRRSRRRKECGLRVKGFCYLDGVCLVDGQNPERQHSW